jgi:hypothetical protein
MLNQKQFETKWSEIKAGVRNLWGKISNQELENYKDNIWGIIEIVEQRYPETKADIRFKLHRLMDSFDNETDKRISLDTSSYQRSPYGDPSKENINMIASEGATIDQSPYTPNRAEADDLREPRTIQFKDTSQNT